MNDTVKNLTATAVVLSGAVLCSLIDSSTKLIAKENQAPAGDVEIRQAQGTVILTTYFSVKIESEEDGLVTFYIPEHDKLVKHEVGQLLEGDKVTIKWRREDRRNWVHDIDGKGVVEGKVTAKGDAWIEVEDKARNKVRYRAPWRGGNPADGGGPDDLVVGKLKTVRVGDLVKVTWSMPEGKRVTDVKILER